MKINIKQIAKTLVEHQDGKTSAEAKKLVKEVVQFMSDNGLLDKWRELEVAIDQAWKEKYGVSKVRVISAHELSKEANNKLVELTKGADLKLMVDDRLIGGAVIRIDDKKIDGSVSGALRRLKMNIWQTN